MRTMTITTARTNLFKLLDEVAQHHEPVLVSGKRHNVVLVSEEDWNAIQETLHLLSIPGMRDSIVEGMNTPIEECSDEAGW